MGWTSYKNYAKDKGEKSWINSRWTWFIGEHGNKHIDIQICSTPSIGWGVDVNGGERDVTFKFWFILKFYISFEYIFPDWVFPREYNQFADEDVKALKRETPEQEQKFYEKKGNNEKLKGRARTKNKGWIRTAGREIDLSFHNYSMWWRFWTDPGSWHNGIPKWRHGSLDFVRLLKGRDKVDSELISDRMDEIEMPEGKYLCKIDYTKFTRRYKRWWPKVWHRFQFEFGYENESGEWIKTPVPHWGKGTMDYNCGMDGTYSISLSCEVKTLEEAKNHVVESCMKDRKRYGNVDFSEVKGIENGYIKSNLVGQF